MANAWADWKELMEKEGERWSKPHPLFKDFVAQLPPATNNIKVYDLGCGAGRHTLFLAALGFDVYASDIEASALAITADNLMAAGLQAHLVEADMITIPFENNFFDAVVAVQVIYHNTKEKIQLCLDEIYRVLKPGGLIFLVTSSEKSPHFGKGKQIAENTFLRSEGHEKDVPHYYFTEGSLRSMLNKFTIKSLILYNQLKGDIPDPHYVAVVIKPT